MWVKMGEKTCLMLCSMLRGCGSCILNVSLERSKPPPTQLHPDIACTKESMRTADDNKEMLAEELLAAPLLHTTA